MKAIKIKGDSVTPKDVNDSILSESYVKMGKKMMICHLTLQDGHEVIGQAGIVNPEKFNEEIGKKIAKENAISNVWGHLGSLLTYQRLCR